MTQERFKELGSRSFFRDLVYERALPEDHVLRKLEEVFTPKLVRLYRGRAKRVRPPYNPAGILKILVLSYFYDLSDLSSFWGAVHLQRQVGSCVAL